MQTSDFGSLWSAVLHHAAERGPKPAFVHGHDSIDYATLAASMDQGAAWLRDHGCTPGDRVVVALPKNLVAIRMIFSTLAAGAIFVPVDPNIPGARLAVILEDARPRIFITTSKVKRERAHDIERLSLETVCLDDEDAWRNEVGKTAARGQLVEAEPDASAVFFYTSGTTGRPKAIILSHLNVASFADWAIQSLGLRTDDQFASHAPLHFDLTTLDLYASTRIGATTVLLDDVTVKFPARVSQLLEVHRVTVWYSVPTALRLLVEFGALDRRDLSSLRLVLFAGEPFPLPALRKLVAALPGRQFYNLCGPTETNVCMHFKVPEEIPKDWVSLPIGIPCEHLSVVLLKENDEAAPQGEKGEIVVFGPSVMAGYWNNPELSASCRVDGRIQSHRTGDIGVLGKDGQMLLIGRRDEMVKIRGHRVELAEIGAVLERVEGVREAIALMVDGDEPTIIAVVCFEEHVDLSRQDLLTSCKNWLPSYAVPGSIMIVAEFPRTSTGKIDKQALKEEIRQKS